tara:strand:- start:42903 stop:43538 length:636 start_codon:yes stop_codon:yes gene_type:complete
MTSGDVKADRKEPGPLRKKRETEVLDAAARVFSRRGYHGTSTQDIAAELDIRQASLYYYFRSKEEALEQVCARGAEGFAERASAISASDLSPREKLTALVEAHCLPLRKNAHFTITFLNERKWLAGDSRKRVRNVSRKVEDIFEEVIRKGIADGVFRGDIDPRLATLAILGMLNSVPHWYGSEPATLEDIQKALAVLACEGIVLRQEAKGA